MITEIDGYDFFMRSGWYIMAGFVVAFFITYVSIPTILKVAKVKGLYDSPNNRSSHRKNIPTLGGMAVFAGFAIATALFSGISESRELLFVFTGLIILFFIGIKDDILIIDPVKKLLGQIFAAAVVVILGDIRITDIHGFLGIYQIGYVSSVLFTLFVFVAVINAFNLIDGIDGLASGMGVLSSVVFGVWFVVAGFPAYAVISFSLTGSLLAFLRFNLSRGKNKIFLGDTGSLILGMMVSVLTVRFLEYDLQAHGVFRISSAPVVAFTVLILPLIDMLHVFFLRILRGHSPLEADRWHLHHRLLELGLSHIQTTGVLLSINLFFILLVFWLQDLGDLPLLGIVLGLTILLIVLLYGLVGLKKHRPHITSGKKAYDVEYLRRYYNKKKT